MSGREKRVDVTADTARQAAIDYVTSGGKNTLKLGGFLPAGRPSGEDPFGSNSTRGVSFYPLLSGCDSLDWIGKSNSAISLSSFSRLEPSHLP